MKLFRKIRQNLLAQGSVTGHITYAIGEILLEVNAIHSPVRDRIWVERTNVPQTNRALRYGTWNLRDGIENHMAYLTARFERFKHRFIPICSPSGTAQDFNHGFQNALAC